MSVISDAMSEETMRKTGEVTRYPIDLLIDFLYGTVGRNDRGSQHITIIFYNNLQQNYNRI